MENPESLLQVMVLPAERGARAVAAGEGAVPWTGALSVSELLKNKCSLVPTLRMINFPSRNCCLGCLMFFTKTTTLSHSYDVFNG